MSKTTVNADVGSEALVRKDEHGSAKIKAFPRGEYVRIHNKKKAGNKTCVDKELALKFRLLPWIFTQRISYLYTNLAAKYTYSEG